MYLSAQSTLGDTGSLNKWEKWVNKNTCLKKSETLYSKFLAVMESKGLGLNYDKIKSCGQTDYRTWRRFETLVFLYYANYESQPIRGISEQM